MSVVAPPCHIGLLLFPAMTQIDFAEPFEIFARLPDTVVHVVAKTLDPVRTDRGLMLVPTVTLEECPPLDVIVVPGGPGTQDLLQDEAMLDVFAPSRPNGRNMSLPSAPGHLCSAPPAYCAAIRRRRTGSACRSLSCTALLP